MIVKLPYRLNFMVAPCISNIKHFIIQLMPSDTNVWNVDNIKNVRTGLWCEGVNWNWVTT